MKRDLRRTRALPRVIAATALAAATLAGILQAHAATPVAADTTSPVAAPAAASVAAEAARDRGHEKLLSHQRALPQLPSPPEPAAGRPRFAGPTHRAAAPRPATTSAGPSAATFGAPGPVSTLVLYDTSSTYGWLGELYAMSAGNLASHFGQVTAQPVTGYVSGQLSRYTAAIYVGSAYGEPLPAALVSDVRSSRTPVVWTGFNVWQLAGPAGSAQNTAFQARYGWDPSTSYLDTTDTITSVRYKGRTLARSAANTGGLLSPHVVTPTAVSVLAQGVCADGTGRPKNCDPIAQVTGNTVPWAIRSANLTYIGEIPFSYAGERDRYLAFCDLLFAALQPAATESHRALVRLEDVSPASDPATLRRFADYLSQQKVPFSVGVIPQYSDPKGVANEGTPRTLTLAQAPQVVSALTYMQSKGGTLVQHGYTHQYSNVSNPYSGVTGDDFEFYRSRCSATQNPPYTFHDPCPITDWVILEGPLPDNSGSWAASRVAAGRALFSRAGLPAPTIFETPHYSASSPGYTGFGQVYRTRYERELLFSGQLTGKPTNAHVFGQFFPYTVHDVYGGTVLPENLGNYEPTMFNNNPPRLPADIVANATANLVVTQGVASFFFHPDYPLGDLKAIVSGIKGLGYTFVPASSLQ